MLGWKKFKKKPIVVEAYRLNGKASVVIAILEGNMRASPGDWIIKGINGELYPCKPDIFMKTYEEVK